MTILIVIATLVGTTFLFYQLYKYIKEKNEDAEQSIIIENFCNVYFIDDGFTVGKDAQANALQHLDNITQSNSFYHNHEEDWIQDHEYEEWFESEEERANQLSIEMLEDEIDYYDEEEFLSKLYDAEIEEQYAEAIENDYDDFLLDFEDENDYYDEEEFLSKFYDDVEIAEQPTKVIENPKSTE
ncbi:MAG: hypothetical protein RBT59_10125 [Arcobacteraceae bacterium]|jgi:hypothetical protein|nr:hypothetical protein [Arcobacteraceae bacterium]